MRNRKQERILVIKTDSLAGFVAAEPVFEQIRRHHADGVISLLTGGALERLARAAPYFDQVAALPDLSTPAGRKALISQVRRSKFNRVYDLCNCETGRKLQAGLGFGKPKWFSVQSAKGSPLPGAMGRSSALALPDPTRLMNAAGLEMPDRFPNLGWALNSRKDSANMQPSWYGLSGSYGLFLPSLDEKRRMPAEHYGHIANEMAAQNITPVMIGDAQLNSFGDDISDLAPDLVDLSGKSDHLQLAALAQQANFFITDHADEFYLALSMGCDGVLISPERDPMVATSGRHVVQIAARGSAPELDPKQIWQTVRNMGVLPEVSMLTPEIETPALENQVWA